jgi:hypothetical protein
LLPSHRIMKRIKNVTITVLTIIDSIRLYSALNAFSKIFRRKYSKLKVNGMSYTNFYH